MRKKKKNYNRASPLGRKKKKKPTSTLNNRLQTQSKEKNKVKQTQYGSKPMNTKKKYI